jgi:hypothetical protein
MLEIKKLSILLLVYAWESRRQKEPLSACKKLVDLFVS